MTFYITSNINGNDKTKYNKRYQGKYVIYVLQLILTFQSLTRACHQILLQINTERV